MVYRYKYLTVPVVASDIETLASLSGFDFCDWSRSSCEAAVFHPE